MSFYEKAPKNACMTVQGGPETIQNGFVFAKHFQGKKNRCHLINRAAKWG